MRDLKARDVRTRLQQLSAGKTRGDIPFGRGRLVYPLRNRRQGCQLRGLECDNGLTGPDEVERSLAPELAPETGNEYPKMVLMTQRSEAGVNP